MNVRRLTILSAFLLLALTISLTAPRSEDQKGAFEYDKFEKPETCQSCHTDIYQQWTQAMMSQAYTHHWDEIEYFNLAVAHSELDAAVKPVADGCNGCHTPLAFLAGDVPPPRPAENSRANESVSCDFCHTVTMLAGDIPHNFSYVSSPGRKKYGAKPGLTSPHHDTEQLDIFREAEFCGSCHNEKNPYGIWVKSTQLEWKEGPYAANGVPCHVCHMPKAPGRSAKMAEEGMVAQHLFHGAHDEGKVKGTVEIRMHPEERELEYDDVVVLKVQLFNGKTGHKFPTGSVEDRIVWLEVEARDASGKTYHLLVDPKGFPGEEYTISSRELAYQDMGIPLKIADFAGVPREEAGEGNRVFRQAFFDPQGRMTIMQWNTASLGVDYRIGPRETKVETYTWELPDDIAVGKVIFTATLNYRKLVKPVADFLKVPAEESEIVVVNRAETWVEVYD